MRRTIFHKLVARLAVLGFFNWLPDKQYLHVQYWACMGKRLNLKEPNTFNEKLQWLKLYNRRPEYTMMVDKYEVKKYVADKIGEEYIIPTLGVWERFDEIDFDCLPDQFVLKCTHDSGGLVIVKDKSKFDKNVAKKEIEACLKRKYYLQNREWPYKNVKPRIIAEKYMEDSLSAELRDYKYFAFNGSAEVMFIATDRGTDTRFDFYDADFKHLPIVNGYPNASKEICKPVNFEKMKELAERLSIGIPHLRVDFYEVNGRVYFGELTFYHWSGMMPFEPESWDQKLGEQIDLSQVLPFCQA